MSEKFRGRYQVEDGYAGKSRPRYVSISADDIEDDMTDDEIKKVYEDAIQQDFEQNIYPAIELADEFVSWAREQLESRED